MAVRRYCDNCATEVHDYAHTSITRGGEWIKNGRDLCDSCFEKLLKVYRGQRD